MRTRALFVAFAVMALSMSVAMAQRTPPGGQGAGGHGGAGHPGMGGGGGIEAMLSQLDLTEAQKQEIQKIREEMQLGKGNAPGKGTGNAPGNRQGAGTTPGAKQGGHPEMHQFLAKVMAILTPEQKKKLHDLMAQHRGHGGPGGPGGGQGPGQQ